MTDLAEQPRYAFPTRDLWLLVLVITPDTGQGHWLGEGLVHYLPHRVWLV